jgi:hypothetical protein
MNDINHSALKWLAIGIATIYLTMKAFFYTLDSGQHAASIQAGREATFYLQLASARGERNGRFKPIDEKKVLVVALTLFGSREAPGEAFLSDDTAAHMAVIDSARNRAAECGTGWTEELLKWGYDKARNRWSAMYSVWQTGGRGPEIGFGDLDRFQEAIRKARELIRLTETTPPDPRITHYHQTGMKDPPVWSKTFRHVKDVGGNSFYQEVGEKGSYCLAKVPDKLPIPVSVKAGKKKTAGKEANELNWPNRKDLAGRLEALRILIRNQHNRIAP